MTDKIQQARRAAFEVWVKREVGEEPQNLYRRDSPNSSRLGQYVNESVESFWIGFNAALDCAVIELPRLIGLNESFQGTPISEIRAQNHYNEAVSKCRAAIESTNLGIKVK